MPDLAFDKIRFGVNYVPSRKWWYCWNDFTEDDHARDFDAIRAMGADHVRIMLIWPWFQPNRRWVSPAHLDRLDRLMRLAGERGLDVCVTTLTGWLSGWAFRPTFDQPESFYSGAEFREPVEIYLTACAERLNRHPNFLGFDLGNELNCCWNTLDLAAGDGWMNWALDLCETLSPGRVHVNGVDHQPWFYPDTFSAANLARRQPLVPIHSWIRFTGALERGKPTEPICTHLAPAMAQLVRRYAGDPAKPVWLQEFGASSEWMPREEIPRFLENSVRAAISGGVCWLTWWDSHDIRPEFEFPSLEYDLGLLTTENELKPAGQAFRRLAAEFSGQPVVPCPAFGPEALPEIDSADRWKTFATTWQWLEAAL
jgi:hypothetical protein